MTLIDSPVKMTIMVDNEAPAGLSVEHGFSLWLEIGEQRIVFDTGQGLALPENLRPLGIELDKADILVLSHGHFDHTGAIPLVLDAAPAVEVYGHPALTQPRYSVRGAAAKSIQMPAAAQAALAKLPAVRLHWVEQPVMLMPGLGLTGFIPRLTDYEDTGGPFFLDPAGTKPDLLADDMALWIATPKGLVICLGCAHAGLINTLHYVRKLSGINKIHAIIGGFHLLSASEARLAQTMTALRDLAPDRVIPCHCTGKKAVREMKAVLGDKVWPGEAGLTF